MSQQPEFEVPYAVKRNKVVWMIQTAPPPTPACFDSQAEWQDYLTYLNASGERLTRRQDLGKWSQYHGGPRRRVVTTVFDRIDFCQDCDIGGDRQRRMQRERRCIIPVPTHQMRQVALFDASTDTLHLQRAEVARQAQIRKTETRIRRATAALKALGWLLIPPPIRRDDPCSNA